MGFVIRVHGVKIFVLHAYALRKRRLHADMHGQIRPPNVYLGSNVWAAQVAHSVCCIRATFVVRFDRACVLLLAFPKRTGVLCDGLLELLVVFVA